MNLRDPNPDGGLHIDSNHYPGQGFQRFQKSFHRNTDLSRSPRGEMSIRDIEVWRGGEVTIQVEQQTHGAEEGSVVWDCSLVLIDYLTKQSKQPATSQISKQQEHPRSVLDGCRVLDLGSGTGVMGLAAHAMGASHVILTDRPSQVNLLQANVHRNRTALQLPGTMEVLADIVLSRPSTSMTSSTHPRQRPL
jgi:hypothetical protein